MTGPAGKGGGAGRISERVRPDVAWLATATGASIAVYAIYLVTHPYPAFGAGLFLEMAETIAAAGYSLPERVPGYTAGGVPFAYPPLPFYLLAVLVDTAGLEPVAVSRFLPGVFVIAALVPYYYVARELLSSVPKAGLATTVLGVTPAVLRWHLSAGGVVRGLAFLFVAVGLHAGVKLFSGGGHRWRSRWQWQWLGLATVAFGLTVLSHPIYTVFFGVSYLVLFWFLDRSVRGLSNGVVVAVGGLVLAAPWWTQVIAAHGVGVFAGAAGTHDGIGGGVGRIVAVFLAPLAPDAETPFFLAAYAGAGYLLYRREYLLPTWLLAAGYVAGKTRFLFVPGAMLIAILVFDALVPWLAATGDRLHVADGRRNVTDGGRNVAGAERFRRLRPAAAPLAVGLVVLSATGLGGLAAAGQLSIWHGGASQPAFVDDDDREAMAWADENAEPGATFVVLGDAAEWFPLVADRPILVGHWGAEWEGADEYRRQLGLYRAVSDCSTERCVTGTLERADVYPDYVYVPKGEYTIQGEANDAPRGLAGSMADATRYELVYENEGVAVFRVVGDSGATNRGPAPPTG